MLRHRSVRHTGIDPKLVRFAGDLNLLQEQGVRVRRYNLAREPARFASQPKVAGALRSQGNACLPLVIVEGEIMTRSVCPTREQLAFLAGLEAPCCCGEADGCCGDEGRDGSCCGR